MNSWMWLFWAPCLIAQNFAFTYVSRARNSGSLRRHMKGALFSNGTYFINLLFSIKLAEYVGGKYGWMAGAGVVAYYSIFTMVGSVWAHYHALKTEKGLNAVGANKKYAQIPVSEWDSVKTYVIDAKRIERDVLASMIEKSSEGIAKA